MKIETPRLILRRWKEKDRAPFAALNADEQVMEFLGALRFAFENWNMPIIYSFAAASNLKSEKVMQKIGMTRVQGGEFDHPFFDDGDPIKKNILYQIKALRKAGL